MESSPVVTLRFSVEALGPDRNARQIRNDVEAAFAEALADVGASESVVHVPVQLSIEPEGGLFAGGAELWLLAMAAKPVAIAGLKIAASAAAGAAGKKAGEAIWETFAKRLRARNILARQAAEAAAPAPPKTVRAAKSANKKPAKGSAKKRR